MRHPLWGDEDVRRGSLCLLWTVEIALFFLFAYVLIRVAS